MPKSCSSCGKKMRIDRKSDVCRDCAQVCECGNSKDHRAAQCQSCAMSAKTKRQWGNSKSRKKILSGIRSAGLKRRRIFEKLTEKSFVHKKVDGRIYAMFWENDKKRYIYRYQWRWIKRFGPISEGMVIHHINRDLSDDRLENLELMSNSEHAKLHSPEVVAARLKAMGQTLNHSKNYVCHFCQEKFTKKPRKERPNKYCSANCYHLARRFMTSQ